MSTDLGSIRVLHVDDEPGFAELAVECLEREDDRITIETASSAGEALDQLADADFDCIVSDYDMPRQNGLEFLEVVRERDADVPFILFTGKGSEEVASRAISAGATDYLRKEGGTSQYEVLANRIKNLVSQARAEREARTTRERFQRLIEESSDVIVVVDPEGNFSYLSPASERILGYQPAELVGENGFDYIHSDDRETAMVRFFAMVEDRGLEPAVEFRFEQPDGSWRWLEARGRNLLEDPVINGIVVYARDITERKAHERTLRRERNRYRALFEAVPEPTVRVRFDDENHPVVREVNEAFEAVFGYTEADIEGRSIDEFVVPDQGCEEAQRIARLTASGDSVEQAVRRQTAHGEREFLLRTNPLLTEGDSTESIGIYVDITEDRERERRLERQNEQLEEFARVVSHDLRNPLHVAEGWLELARDSCDTDALDAVANALARMDTLIEDLLRLASEGEVIGSVEPVDLAALAVSCWEHVETGRATFDIDTSRTIRGDASRLRQVLENLLRNAVEHGGPNVTVTMGDLDDGFYLEDDGPGIPEADQERVFNAGFSTAGDGAGVGLSIVQEIAEAHGWSIEVTNGSVGGARFEVTGVGAEDS